ncbi:MAG: hypothetical protein ACJAYJ_003819 [Saprospiraceae bacterium]|jgi:hypothetical protein
MKPTVASKKKILFRCSIICVQVLNMQEEAGVAPYDSPLKPTKFYKTILEIY